MDEHLKTGATGEELACRYLESLGYTIHERNWRYGHLEIDIIAQWGGTLVIRGQDTLLGELPQGT